MTLTSLDRVIINRMAILNKHDYDGLMKFTHIMNRNLNITELKKRRKYNRFFF